MIKRFSLINVYIVLSLLTINECYAQAKNNDNKFILITMLYNEKNPKRVQEYITCLEKNLAHDRIDTIHVFYDTSNDYGNNAMLKYLKSKEVVITYIEGRATYQDCFNLANERYPYSRIIISNADIYFNDTLKLLDDYNLTDKFLALTRWDVKRDCCIKPFTPFGSYSQDTWIFESPIRKFNGPTIQLGTPGCDNKIAFQAHKSGLKVTNPCKTIQCCHVHLSGIRNYNPPKPLRNGFKVVFGIKNKRVRSSKLEQEAIKHRRHRPKRRR